MGSLKYQKKPQQMMIDGVEFQDIFTIKPNNHYIYPKFTEFQLGKYLKLSEFQCKCRHADCNYSIIYSYNISCFNKVRGEFGFPITITSGFRCQRHNLNSDGVENSDHMKGEAIDITPVDFSRIDELERIARIHYKTVIRYPRFIHCSN
jgi:hypothetical protein